MLPRSLSVLSLSGLLAIASSAGPAFGQCAPYGACCIPPARVTACYQTVPVTEYRECRQTVQRPVVETTYVDQPVTEYRQVCENKTAEIPTVSYQTVCETRTVQKDCGHWIAQCHERPMITPCQYDNRPGLFGVINRTGFSVRMAFTPRVWTERVYVPNIVAQQVPVTRQVAIRGSQTVNYQVSRMVPITTTRKVAVNTVRMVSQEIVTQRPVVVYKTVPMGNSLALGVPATSPTTTAARQSTLNYTEPIAIQTKKSGNATAPERTAKRQSPLNEDDAEDAFRERDSNSGNSKPSKKSGTDQGSIKVPAADEENAGPAKAASSSDVEVAVDSDRPIGRWVARKKTKGVNGPAFPEMAQAGVDRVKR